MINLPKYNPCADYIEYLKKHLKDRLCINKALTIKYDKKCFITNLTSRDINKKLCVNDFESFISAKGILIIKPGDDFFKDNIKKCPVIPIQLTNNLFLDSIVKRMYSQISFNFFSINEVNKDEIDLCYSIFKAIYAKSLAIKLGNIKDSIDKFNCIQREKHLNHHIIRGIIYSVYDYFNLLEIKQ